jgi:uncharacterized protein
MLGMFALAIAFVMGTRAIRDGMESRNPRDKIVVAGSARRPVESDRITWRVSLTSRQETAEDTIAELDDWFGRVQDFMRKRGIRASEMRLLPVELDRRDTTNEEGETELIGFTATRALRVSSTRLDVVESMTSRSDELIADGIPIVASSPEWVFTKLSDHRRDMIQQAGEDAKKRAETLAKVGGAGLGRVTNVEVGDFSVTSRGGTNFESGGTFDRGSRLKDVVIVVHLTFELD